jgi:hypothetical protein
MSNKPSPLPKTEYSHSARTETVRKHVAWGCNNLKIEPAVPYDADEK